MFHILGGEPLHQIEFQECLDFFAEHSSPNLKWKIFSNLKHDTRQFAEKLQKIESLISEKKIKAFEVVASMDCWGPEAEFSRSGMKLENWEQNFELLLANSWVEQSIQTTISSVTLPSMHVLADKVSKWSEKKEIVHSWNTVAYPTFFNPDFFGNFLTPFFDQLMHSVSQYRHQRQSSLDYLEGFRRQVTCAAVNRSEMQILRAYLNEIDRRHNTDWKQIYPWMNSIFETELPPL